MAGVKRKLSTESDAVHAHAHALHKELDEVSCPVCMDHPHNAVLLLCSSHDKGCRSYICDTSYRHSNCLDRFKKLHSESPLNDHAPEGANNGARNVHRVSGNQDSESMRRRRRRVGEEEEEQSEETTATANLKCPLCRGDVLGWKAVEEVRSYLDMKNRSCSRESCSFIGNYHDLRRHARRIHPATRPSDTDPTRERAWRRLENQREYGDIVSAIRSAMPGAVVVGDYVIENGDRFSGEREAGNGGGGGGSDLWTTLVLFQMIGSLEGNVGGSSGGGSGSVGGSRTHRSRAWRNHRRSSSDRRYLWGENLLGLQDEHNNDNDDDDDQELRLQNDTGDDLNHVPRRRRRFGRPRSSGNHPR